jgi:hypothetical protein
MTSHGWTERLVVSSIIAEQQAREPSSTCTYAGQPYDRQSVRSVCPTGLARQISVIRARLPGPGFTAAWCRGLYPAFASPGQVVVVVWSNKGDRAPAFGVMTTTRPTVRTTTRCKRKAIRWGLDLILESTATQSIYHILKPTIYIPKCPTCTGCPPKPL